MSGEPGVAVGVGPGVAAGTAMAGRVGSTVAAGGAAVVAGTAMAGSVGSSVAAGGDTFGDSEGVASAAIGDGRVGVGDAVGTEVGGRVASGVDSVWVQANPITARNTRRPTIIKSLIATHSWSSADVCIDPPSRCAALYHLPSGRQVYPLGFFPLFPAGRFVLPVAGYGQTGDRLTVWRVLHLRVAAKKYSSHRPPPTPHGPC